MPDTLRLGLVGAGAIAQSYIKALEGSSLGRWVGIADVRREAAEAAAELMGCDAYRSHEDLADRAACDAVVICTPPASHAEIATHFIERDIAVLCEKPLSIDVGSARALCAAPFHEVVDKCVNTVGVRGHLWISDDRHTGR